MHDRWFPHSYFYCLHGCFPCSCCPRLNLPGADLDFSVGRQNLNYQQGSGEVRLEAEKATTAPDTLLNTIESMCLDSLQTAPPLDKGVERLIPSFHCLLEGGFPWYLQPKEGPGQKTLTVAAVS